MRSPLTLALVAGVAALLPATDAFAISRTVTIQTRVVNHTDSDVYVQYSGAYVGGAMTPTDGTATIEPAAFTGDDFGNVHPVDSNGAIAFRGDPDHDLFHNAQNKSAYTITTGHTHHFSATFYERIGTDYRAFASYEWIAQVNISGVNQCHPVRVVDPQQRLVGAHKRPDNTNYPNTLYDKGFTEGEISAVLGPALARRGMPSIIGRSLASYASLYRSRNSDTYGYYTEFFKNGPNVCLTQLWVLPEVPKATIDFTQLGMRGWGYAGYSFAGDFNGDGRADLVSAVDRYLMMAPSRGPWMWDQLQVDTGANSYGSTAYTWTGDFDGDGALDLASANAGTVYVRRKANNFQVEAWPVPNHWGDAGYTRVGDFNGDGKDDIASAYGGTVYVKLSTGSGFTEQAWGVPNNWGAAGYTFIGDFNGDDKDDIATAYYGNVYLKLSTGTGFQQVVWTVPSVWGSAGYSFVGDFNGDGKSDLATANGGTIHTFVSTGASFTARQSAVANVWGAAGYTRVGDFDGDGRDDIASANAGTVYLNAGNADGTFTRRDVAVDNWWGAAEYTFVADFDGDGADDLATANGGEVRVRFFSH